MKKVFPRVIKRSAVIIFNKAVCLNLALVMLFNLTSPVFAAHNQNKQEEEKLFEELNQELQAEYAKKSSLPMQSALDLCVKNGDKKSCDRYIDDTNKMFFTTAQEASNTKEVKEESFTPLSKQAYVKDLRKSVEEEFKTHLDELQQEFSKQSEIINQQYKGVGINSPRYQDYIFAKSALDNWQKENLQALNEYKKEAFTNADKEQEKFEAGNEKFKRARKD
ncbi:MAG: hypothetical protein II972_01580, partial [Elusimicrobiaceae bacterium]|nr:hypothetical protein [Elusimicrobiaceae bacterium]